MFTFGINFLHETSVQLLLAISITQVAEYFSKNRFFQLSFLGSFKITSKEELFLNIPGKSCLTRDPCLSSDAIFSVHILKIKERKRSAKVK